MRALSYADRMIRRINNLMAQIPYRKSPLQLEDWEAHILIVSYIKRYGVPKRDCFYVYYNCMKTRLQRKKLTPVQLHRMYHDKTTEEWYSAKGKEEEKFNQTFFIKTAEETIQEAIGRLKTKARFVS